MKIIHYYLIITNFTSLNYLFLQSVCFIDVQCPSVAEKKKKVLLSRKIMIIIYNYYYIFVFLFSVIVYMQIKRYEM